MNTTTPGQTARETAQKIGQAPWCEWKDIRPEALHYWEGIAQAVLDQASHPSPERLFDLLNKHGIHVTNLAFDACHQNYQNSIADLCADLATPPAPVELTEEEVREILLAWYFQEKGMQEYRGVTCALNAILRAKAQPAIDQSQFEARHGRPAQPPYHSDEKNPGDAQRAAQPAAPAEAGQVEWVYHNPMSVIIQQGDEGKNHNGTFTPFDARWFGKKSGHILRRPRTAPAKVEGGTDMAWKRLNERVRDKVEGQYGAFTNQDWQDISALQAALAAEQKDHSLLKLEFSDMQKQAGDQLEAEQKAHGETREKIKELQKEAGAHLRSWSLEQDKSWKLESSLSTATAEIARQKSLCDRWMERAGIKDEEAAAFKGKSDALAETCQSLRKELAKHSWIPVTPETPLPKKNAVWCGPNEHVSLSFPYNEGSVTDFTHFVNLPPLPTPPIDTERERFEKWMDAIEDKDKTIFSPKGVERMWQAWLARAKQGREAV